MARTEKSIVDSTNNGTVNGTNIVGGGTKVAFGNQQEFIVAGTRSTVDGTEGQL